MPIFEYKCDACRAEFEKLVFSSDDRDITCPDCHSDQVRKKMSATSFTGSSGGSTGGCAGGTARPFS